MARVEKTVFISYRRTDVFAALAVYQDLNSKGYDVFFDYRNIASGDFEQIILGNIRARAHFVLILTPTALDRCSESGDWLRREIETAMDEKRNIVPLFFKGFSFGNPSVKEKLTGKLRKVSKYNGLNVHEDYFDAAMDRLRGQFLEIPLDTVLHPVSARVRKVVKEEQVAADQALHTFAEQAELKPRTATSAAEKSKHIPEMPGVQAGGKSPSSSIQKPITPAKTTPGGHVIYTFGDIEFVKVTAGRFLMGSSEKDKEANPDEKPQHTADIPYDYYMARFPVTNGQYAAYVQANGEKHPVSNWEQQRDHPTVNVSWNDAMAYCRWLNESLKSELLSRLVLRLPTEAEWEKAGRGANGLIYPWGDSFEKNKCNTVEGGKGDTTPVGLYSPQGDSPYGCADMSGNVWEWTHSLYKSYPYKAKDGREDDRSSGPRVLRGGSFFANVRSARCASRFSFPIGIFYIDVGFRVAASPALL